MFLTCVQKIARRKATEGVFTRSVRCVKPSNRDDEDADDTDYVGDDKSRTHTQYILKYL